MLLDDITESEDKLLLIVLALKIVHEVRFGIMLQEVLCQFLIVTLHLIEGLTHDVFQGGAIAEQLDRLVHLAFQVTKANHLTETLLLVKHTVGTAESLQQAMILHVFVNIESVEFLAVKASKEHTDNQAEVKRLHVCLLFLHAKVNVIVICTEVLCSETRSIHIIIVIHDGLQFVCIACAVTRKTTGVHASLFVVLAAVCSVCEHRSDSDLRVEALEYLIVADEHRHRLHGKQCVKLSIEC